MTLQPDLHDGFLVSIALQGSDTAVVGCRTVTNQSVTLVLTGLERFRADNFLEGNIILEARVLTGDAIPMRLLARVMMEPDGAESVARMHEKAKKEEWSLLEIESSYGCDVVALCRNPIRIE